MAKAAAQRKIIKETTSPEPTEKPSEEGEKPPEETPAPEEPSEVPSTDPPADENPEEPEES